MSGSTRAYRHAVLIDGLGGPARPGTTIVVEGETITAVTPDADAGDLSGAEIVDLTGHWVVPGLVDTHQHLATPPDRPLAEAQLRRQLAKGVTLIRSMADDLRQIADLARATLVGELPGPDIAYAALMAGPSFFTDPRTIEVTQGTTPGTVPWMQAITPDTDLPLAVALARGTGASAIKLYADLPADLATAIATEARRQGIDVWAHAALFPAVPSEVVATGATSLSHALMLAYEDQPRSRAFADRVPLDHSRFADDLGPRVAAVLAEMRRRGTILDATATVYATAGFADERVALSTRIVTAAHRAGVEISTGTDYESPPESEFPALHDELDFLVASCGLTPAEVLRSATLVGARAAGQGHLRGSIEPGKLADLVALTADPLADIANLRAVAFTVKRGRPGPEPRDALVNDPDVT